MRILILFFLLVLTSCNEAEQSAPPVLTDISPPVLVLTAVDFSVLPDWGSDNFETFVTAFQRTCMRISKKPMDQAFGFLEEAGTYGDWQAVCQKFQDQPALSPSFFEENFIPYQVSADHEPIGLFTGYYEASLRGSRTRTPPYTVPIYARPDDLVMVDLGQFRDELKGQRIAGRVVGGNLKPYESRADIVSGNWPHTDKVLLWLDDPVDAFFVQIQGSGLVQMDDGSLVRIGYAGQNGHPYYAIGRELIKMGILTKETVSMQSIRAWLEANPDTADEIMNTNKSYVFFHEVEGDGPLGAEGVALTGGRSLAVDRTQIPYGVPLWVDIDKPVESANPIRRLMIAQDTGGAITGAVRGDVFWGYGDIAESMAGQMKSRGRYWVLLPKNR